MAARWERASPRRSLRTRILVAQGGPAEGLAGGGERGDDALLDVARAVGAFVAGVDECEMGVTAALVGDELQREGVGGLGGAVLDGEGEVALVASQVEVGVAPGVQVAGAA